MANGTNVVNIPDDFEFRVIGNFFGLLIASGGLLAGNMMHEHSLEYWQEDIVPIILTFLLAFRLMRSLVVTMTVCMSAPPRPPSPVNRENIQRMHATVAQLPETSSYSPEQVVDEVVRRIEKQKTEAAKRAGGG